MAQQNRFAERLRWWRGRRGLSQIELAGRAGVSQRHLSFLELGRSAPSRDMVVRLAATLDLPLRQQNALLAAAGYAPAWRESGLGAPDLVPVRRALDFMLAQQEPFPAVVVDRHWNLLLANRGAVRLVEFLVGPLDPAATVNLADALCGPDALRPHLQNWAEVVRYFIRSVEQDALADGSEDGLALLQRLTGYEGVASGRAAPEPAGQAPVLPMHFRKDGVDLHLFTTLATFGTPRDVTLQEIRVECFFPVDEATDAVFRAWAVEAPT